MDSPGVLRGRTALITGAAGGIGSALTMAFADEGARLALTDLDADRLQRTAAAVPSTVQVSMHTCDVTLEQQVTALVDDVLRQHESIDILINCAGILSVSRMAEMDSSTWDEMIAADLRSVFLCSRQVVAHMVRRRWGRIINISSQLGIIGEPGLTHYTAAKAAVHGLTKALALEVAADNVLVNAIAPGPIETPMIASLDPEYKRQKQASLPLRRFGVPIEVAPTAVLLASDPGGNLYTGQVLGPNCGDAMP